MLLAVDVAWLGRDWTIALYIFFRRGLDRYDARNQLTIEPANITGIWLKGVQVEAKLV